MVHKVHKGRIIAGMEEVLEGYRQDHLLLQIISGYTDPAETTASQRLNLTPRYFRPERYFLTYQGNYIKSRGGELDSEVSPLQVAEAIYPHYSFTQRGRGPLTVTKARAWIDQDLGERVRRLKLEHEV